MEWVAARVVVPLKRALVAMASRVRAEKDAGAGGGDMPLKLRDEVQACGDEDVRVMWEILLQRSGVELVMARPSECKKKHRRPAVGSLRCVRRTMAACVHGCMLGKVQDGAGGVVKCTA